MGIMSKIVQAVASEQGRVEQWPEVYVRLWGAVAGIAFAVGVVIIVLLLLILMELKKPRPYGRG
jgi:hypothetical protein